MNAPLHIGQPHVAAGVAEGEAFVVEAEQMQDRGMPVVDVALVEDRFVTEVVGRAVAEASLHTATGHPCGIAGVVAVAAVGGLSIRGATEFAAPEDQRVLQQSPFGQVVQQPRDGLVGRAGMPAVVFLQITVLIPAAVADFDEAHARFEQSPSHQALPTEVIGPGGADAIQRLRPGRLAAQADHFAGIHRVADDLPDRGIDIPDQPSRAVSPSRRTASSPSPRPRSVRRPAHDRSRPDIPAAR